MKQWVLAAVVLFVSLGYCGDGEVVKVRGRGVGLNRAEALKDAYRNAIENAVGLYVRLRA